MPKQARTQSKSSSQSKKIRELFILNKGDSTKLGLTKDNMALFLMSGPKANIWEGFACSPDALDELRQIRFHINIYLRKFKKKPATKKVKRKKK